MSARSKSTRAVRRPKKPAPKPPAADGYEERIVTFFDILGFSRFVEERRPASDVEEVLKLTRYAADYSTAIGGPSPWEEVFTNFSDCVVRSARVDGQNARHPIGLAWHELISLVYIQTNLAVKGILIRGAITF